MDTVTTMKMCRSVGPNQCRVNLPALDHDEYVLELDNASSLWQGALSKVGRDNEYLLSLSLSTWSSLLADSPWGYKPVRVIHRFVTSFLSDPFGLIATYDALAHTLRRSCVRGPGGAFRMEPLHHLFRGTPVFKEYHLYYKHHDPRMLAYVLSFLQFCKKVVWEQKQLKTSALRAWVDLEAKLSEGALPSWTKNIRTIMIELTSDWSDFTFLPKHGSGAVAQRLPSRGRVIKNNLLKLSPKLQQVYVKEGYRPSYATLHELGGWWDARLYAEKRAMKLPTGKTKKKPGGKIEVDLDRSRLTFVPKSYKAVRSICMEPIAYQFAQQGVLHWMASNMKDYPISKFVRLGDQSYNREYARLGSKTSELDTIDLSSASDSVSWDLIKVVFPARILKHLAATRTSRVELPSGDVVDVHKFAPMGSATCFPVQTLLYLCVCLYAGIMLSLDQDVDYECSPEDVRYFLTELGEHKATNLHPPRVYGDDIVCDSLTTQIVISLLSALRFTVNVEKSFIGDAVYRESCGGHYVNGDDVTYFQFKAESAQDSLTIDALGSLIDSANLALSDGYVNTRSSLVRHILTYPITGVKKEKGRNPILFVEHDNTDASMALRSLQPHNNHLKKRLWTDTPECSGCKARRLLEERYCADSLSLSRSEFQRLTSVCTACSARSYQRDEVRSITVKSATKIKVPLRQHWYFYLQWWRDRVTDEGEQPLVTARNMLDWCESTSVFNPDALDPGPAWRWTPT